MGASLLAHKIPNQTAAMAPQSIPDHQQLAGDVPQQMREELDHLRAADAAWRQSKVEISPSHARHVRQGLPC